jgi:hypothetical protein
MATLVNEGLTARAKLTGAIAGCSGFTKYVLLEGEIPVEAATVGYSDILAHIIASAGGEAVTVSSITYVADYKTQWQHTFSFTGDLTITGMGIINTDGSPKLLMYHKWTTAIVVHNLETAQITSTETEGRA